MSAAAKSKAPGKPKAPARPAAAGLKALAVSGLSGAMAVAAPAIFMLILVGMAPTLVASLVDGAGRRGGVTPLAAANLAGVLPVLARLWQEGPSLHVALSLLGDVYVWALMYGAAGLAVLLLWVAPVGARLVLDLHARQHRLALARERDKLRQEWGPQIVNDAAGEMPRLK